MSVLNIIRKMKEKDREIRLLILGLDNAGKTTILQRFLGEDINDISPTVGFNIKTIQYHSKAASQQQTTETIAAPNTYNISIWDIGGQSTIRSFWSNYFSNTDGLIWVIDSTDISRFDICIETLKQVLQQDRLAGTSLLILANKLDVPFAYTLEQIAQLLGLQTMVHTIPTTPLDHEEQNNNTNNDKLSSSSSSTTIIPNPSDPTDPATEKTVPTTSLFTSTSSSIISSSSHHWFVHGCSALTNTGIHEAFDALIENIIHRIYSIHH